MVRDSKLGKSHTTHGVSAKGFTMAEVMISVGVLSLIMTGVMSSWIQIARSSQEMGVYVENNLDAQNFSRVFEENIRQCLSVNSLTSSSITIVLNDGSTSIYGLSNGQLIEKNTNGGSTSSTSHMPASSFVVSGYNSNFAATNTASEVRYVSFEIDANNSDGGASSEFSYSSPLVALMNR